MLRYLEDGFTSSFLVAILIVKRGNRMQCRVDEGRAAPWAPKDLFLACGLMSAVCRL